MRISIRKLLSKDICSNFILTWMITITLQKSKSSIHDINSKLLIESCIHRILLWKPKILISMLCYKINYLAYLNLQGLQKTTSALELKMTFFCSLEIFVSTGILEGEVVFSAKFCFSRSYTAARREDADFIC